MPPAKKPASPRSQAFKEPAALKRLSRSLESAQEALAELRKDTERDVSHGARDLYGDLRTFRRECATRYREADKGAPARFRARAKTGRSWHDGG